MNIQRNATRWSLALALAMPVVALAQAGSPSTASVHEPTIDQIYKAAEAGRLGEADTMIASVLNAHPDSGKAHFIHSELLAKEGHLAAARAEYAKANELAPGLPFAKPQAVAGLLQRIDASAPTANRGMQAQTQTRVTEQAPRAEAPSGGFGLPTKIGLVVLIGAAAAWFFRRRPTTASPSMNAAPAYPASPSGGNGYAASSYGGMPTGYAPAAPTYGAAPAGSGLGGALMTGAAMGLGAVAVEEAVRHFTHRDDRSDNVVVNDRAPPPGFGERLGPDVNADMGGNDFGLTDSGSWDSGGGTDDSNGW